LTPTLLVQFLAKEYFKFACHKTPEMCKINNMKTKLKKSETRKVAEDQKILTVKLKVSKNLEKHLTYLEAVSKKPKSFIVKEAIIQYLEDAEDMAKVAE
jgi:hypothetical protein